MTEHGGMYDEDHDNNLVAMGAVYALLSKADQLLPGQRVTSLEMVADAEGNPTNQLDIGFSFMLSPYRLTVERVT